MTDWKQITARIRRARTSKDPAGQLSNLYQKTRDAMVAFELAKFFETSGQNADAAKWYSAAAERFRRSDWKVKAQEAAVRLGGAPEEIPLEAGAPPTQDFALTPPAVSTPEPGLPFEQNPEALPDRQTGRSVPRPRRTGCTRPNRVGPDELLLRGSLPDAAHRHRQLVAWRQPPRSGFDQAAARAVPGNSGNARCEVSGGALR